jgi:hypothetical protein
MCEAYATGVTDKSAVLAAFGPAVSRDSSVTESVFTSIPQTLDIRMCSHHGTPSRFRLCSFTMS